jgi:hypothetical protein
MGENSSYRYMAYYESGNESQKKNSIDILTMSPTVSGTILQIPLDACIIAETPELLSKKLAKERDLGKDSFYEPYINVLPSLDNDNSDGSDGSGIDIHDGCSLRSMPRFWERKRVELVTNADGGQMERKLMEDERKELDPWAHACVVSRANYVYGHGFAMTPILDMINHDGSVSTSAKIVHNNDDNGNSKDELHLSINDDFEIGNEVKISYGELTNLETLCNYGFISPPGEHCNKFNTECIDILLMRKAPVKVTISDVDGRIDLGAIATLRSNLATPAELDKIYNNDSSSDGNANVSGNVDSSNKFFTAPISDSNEEEVFSLIASFIDEAITDATDGVDKVRGEDDLVERYLQCRADTLKKGLEYVKKKFPDLEY